MSDHVLNQPVEEVAAAGLIHHDFTADPHTDGGTVVLRLHGELDMAAAPRLVRALNAALDASPTAITLDLSGLTFVDSTGIGVFVAGYRRATGIGCPFVLRSPRLAVLRTLRLIGIDRLIAIDEAAG